MERYIGLAIRAREVIFGLDNIVGCRKKIFVVVIDDTLQESSRHKIEKYCADKNIRFFYVTDLESKVKKCGVKVIGVTNKNIAEQIIN